MNRSKFFKSFLTLIAAPSVISEIDLDKKPSFKFSTEKEIGKGYFDGKRLHRLTYDEISQQEVEKLYSYEPKYSQEIVLHNGNVLVYGGVTDNLK